MLCASWKPLLRHHQIMATRSATHAGTWYSGSPSQLSNQLDKFLTGKTPVKGARLLVGPHAGYAYAGATLGETYGAFNPEGIKRLFILGPSHHVGFRGAMLSCFDNYETPLGVIPVDTDAIEKLKATGLFKMMTRKIDEDEHSFEMHAPFIYKVSHGTIPIVPIMLGTTDASYDRSLAEALTGYFKDPTNAFAISTDFCHWGRRFDYTAYTTDPEALDLRDLSPVSKVDSKVPIYKGIEILDKLGMTTASTGSYQKWSEYLEYTDNTICGRIPLGILILVLELAQSSGRLQWIGYSQSSSVKDIHDSSVSYASGYAIC